MDDPGSYVGSDPLTGEPGASIPKHWIPAILSGDKSRQNKAPTSTICKWEIPEPRGRREKKDGKTHKRDYTAQWHHEQQNRGGPVSPQRAVRLPASEDPSNGLPDPAGEPGCGQDLWWKRAFLPCIASRSASVFPPGHTLLQALIPNVTEE